MGKLRWIEFIFLEWRGFYKPLWIMHFTEFLLPFYTENRQMSEQSTSFLKAWMQIWFLFCKKREGRKGRERGDGECPEGHEVCPYVPDPLVVRISAPTPPVPVQCCFSKWKLLPLPMMTFYRTIMTLRTIRWQESGVGSVFSQ